MSQIDNIFIQVRSLLQQSGIKLWLEPYYYEEIGPVESEIEKLAEQFSQTLGISVDHCKSALSELQDGALTKLQARKEFNSTGIATFKVKTVRLHDSSSVTTVKCPLTDTGRQLQEKLAKQLKVDFNRIKIICSGRVVQTEGTLADQNIPNNQQLMVLVGEDLASPDNNSMIYDRVKKAKEDAQLVMEANHYNFFRMEDQDGNAVHLPASEKKAITMALALYEKGRAAMKKDKYAEALVLFLEADQEFSACSSSILNTVDNYALLNLDIVWCYLCLKSFSQLPDAERRLRICEQNFERSYGKNMDRVLALKGSSQNEKTLIMRLHLLQAILFFHQNRRNEAYEKLTLAEEELNSLKVNETSFLTLLEMGYGTTESRIALRSCSGDIEKAINFINDKRMQQKEAQNRNAEQEKLHKKFHKLDKGKDVSWVDQKNLTSLIEMGFEKEMAFVALKLSKNDVQSAVDMLQNNVGEILEEIDKSPEIDKDHINELEEMGFDREMVKATLKSVSNNSNHAIELLNQLKNDGCYNAILNALKNKDEKVLNEAIATVSALASTSTSSNQPGPSSASSSSGSNVMEKFLSYAKGRMKNEMETLQAYQRFSEDISPDADEYLDNPLVTEENILVEYKRLLEQ